MKYKISKELLETIAAAVAKTGRPAKIATRGLIQHGGSLSVTLPCVWCQDNRLNSKDKVDFFRSPTGSLIIRVHKEGSVVKKKEELTEKFANI